MTKRTAPSRIPMPAEQIFRDEITKETSMRQAEAPCTRSSLFLLGQNRQGNWVVQDQRGLCGGIFVNRTEALRFAMFENGNRPQGVLMIPGVFELDMRGRQVSAAAQRRMGSQATGRVGIGTTGNPRALWLSARGAPFN